MWSNGLLDPNPLPHLLQWLERRKKSFTVGDDIKLASRPFQSQTVDETIYMYCHASMIVFYFQHIFASRYFHSFIGDPSHY